jgi:hypothetical protein
MPIEFRGLAELLTLLIQQSWITTFRNEAEELPISRHSLEVCGKAARPYLVDERFDVAEEFPGNV